MKSDDITKNQKTQSNSLRAVLARLDSYMDATGHGADHPWRTEIAAALATPSSTRPDTDAILDSVDDIDLAAAAIADLLSLGLQECVNAGNVRPAESALRAARRYIDDIGVATAFIACGGAA
ncbi:hypothetical protein HHL21_12030 [Massilia sp. RP-1-19]|uniref:Uncharacterized protein n=1 Tax=Massilia polaris TaxID=2728846 RepID=A0A848HK60_9BURK|nr:hypothetical protein [Massilia polaris]NML61795.1 hypothetical protein [Massilia polaris]